MEVDVSKLLALPAAERLELAEMLWPSVANGSTDEAPLFPAEKAELDERLDEYEAAGDVVVSDQRR